MVGHIKSIMMHYYARAMIDRHRKNTRRVFDNFWEYLPFTDIDADKSRARTMIDAAVKRSHSELGQYHISTDEAAKVQTNLKKIYSLESLTLTKKQIEMSREKWNLLKTTLMDLQVMKRDMTIVKVDDISTATENQFSLSSTNYAFNNILPKYSTFDNNASISAGQHGEALGLVEFASLQGRAAFERNQMARHRQEASKSVNVKEHKLDIQKRYNLTSIMVDSIFRGAGVPKDALEMDMTLQAKVDQLAFEKRCPPDNDRCIDGVSDISSLKNRSKKPFNDRWDEYV